MRRVGKSEEIRLLEVPQVTKQMVKLEHKPIFLANIIY